MLENMKFISRAKQDISLVRFAHSWDILFNTRNKFHISAQPCNILYTYIEKLFPYIMDHDNSKPECDWIAYRSFSLKISFLE